MASWLAVQLECWAWRMAERKDIYWDPTMESCLVQQQVAWKDVLSGSKWVDRKVPGLDSRSAARSD